MYERSYIWTINSNMNKWAPKDRFMFVFGGIAYFEFCSIFFKRSNYGMNVRLQYRQIYKLTFLGFGLYIFPACKIISYYWLLFNTALYSLIKFKLFFFFFFFCF